MTSLLVECEDIDELSPLVAPPSVQDPMPSVQDPVPTRTIRVAMAVTVTVTVTVKVVVPVVTVAVMVMVTVTVIVTVVNTYRGGMIGTACRHDLRAPCHVKP